MFWDLREGKNRLLADFVGSMRVTACVVATSLLLSSTACATNGDCANKGLPTAGAYEDIVRPLPEQEAHAYIAEFHDWTITGAEVHRRFISTTRTPDPQVRTYGAFEFWPLKPANDRIIGNKAVVTSMTIHGESIWHRLMTENFGEPAYAYRDFKGYGSTFGQPLAAIEGRLIESVQRFRQTFIADLKSRNLFDWIKSAALGRGLRGETDIEHWFVLGTGTTYDKALTATRRARGSSKLVVDFDRDVRAQYEADLLRLELDFRTRLQRLLGDTSPLLTEVPRFPNRRVPHPLFIDYVRKELNDKSNEPFSKIEIIRKCLGNTGVKVEAPDVVAKTLEEYLFLLNMFPLNPLIEDRQRLTVTSAPYGTLYTDFVGINGRENLFEAEIAAAQLDPENINADVALAAFRDAEQRVTRRLDAKKAFMASHITDLLLRDVAGNRPAIFGNRSHITGDDMQFSPIVPLKDNQLLWLAQRTVIRGHADEHRHVFVHGRDENKVELSIATQGEIGEEGQKLHKKLSTGLIEVVKLFNAAKFQVTIELWPNSEGRHTVSVYMLGGNTEAELSSVLFRMKVKLNGLIEERGWKLKEFKYLRSIAIPPISDNRSDFRIFADGKQLDIELVNSFARAV